jgi:hypothetical protein
MREFPGIAAKVTKSTPVSVARVAQVWRGVDKVKCDGPARADAAAVNILAGLCLKPLNSFLPENFLAS